jgi:hypothetical protein
MTKKIRDYLFTAFIIIFLVGTTLISIYASGYQINLSWPPTFNRLFIKTGMIIVDSNPSGATIYLNDEPQANFSINPWKKEYLTTSSAKIKNVLPGEYNLTLKLAGYWPLTKKIMVYSGQTTYVKDINLFRSNLPRLLQATPTSDLRLSASRQYLYIPAAKTVLALTTSQSIPLPAAATSSGVWLKNSDQLLSGGQLFDPSNNSDLDYSQLLGSGATNWSDDENSHRLYYLNQNSLNYYDLSSQASVMVLSGEDFLTYEPSGDYVFIVAVKNGQTVLQRYSLKTQKVEQEANLPTVGHYVFVPNSRPYLTLDDDRNKTLYILDPANITNLGLSLNNVVSWQWLDDSTLLYNNNWEIYRLDLQQNQNSLLTRVSQPLVKILWNSNNNYLIYSTADGLYAYDLTVGLTTPIFQTTAVAAPALDESNDTLYFWAKIGQTSGVYNLLLQ